MPTGGLISINSKFSKQLQKKLKSQRWCGISNRQGVNYDVQEIGWNNYMNEFSAAIGLVQLKKLDQLNKQRKKIAKLYHEKLNIIHKMPLDYDCSYHFYWIIVENRDEFREKMTKRGIETGIHYKPIHKMTMYNQKKKLPITEELSKKIVSLPTHPNLKNDDVDFIIRSVNKFN